MENHLYLYLSIVLTIILISCKKQVNDSPVVYDFEIYKSKEIRLDDDDRDYIYHSMQLVTIDDNDVIAINVGWHKLSFYRISDGKKIHETKIDNSNRLEAFYFINKDSIFLSFECPYYSRKEEQEKPTTKMLVDYDGNIKVIYGNYVDDKSVLIGQYSKDSILPAKSNALGEICITENNIFFPACQYCTSPIGTKEFMNDHRPLVSRLDTKENKYYFSKTKHYPFVQEGTYYQSVSVPMFITRSPYGRPLLSYFYSNVIFEWDWHNDSLLMHNVQSRLLDTIFPASTPNQYDFEIPAYFYDIKYDKKDSIFFRTMYFNENVYGKLLYGLVVFNKDFEYLGEIYEQNSWPTLSNENVLIDVIPYGDSILNINYLNVIKTERNFTKYIDSCKNDLMSRKIAYDNLKDQLCDNNNPVIRMLKKQRELVESNYKILTLYSYSGCVGCVDAVISVIQEYKDIINKLPFYIIISANGKEEANDEINRYGLDEFDKLCIDDIGLLKSLAGSNYLLNPRITVVNDGVVTLDTIYQAMDIEDKLLPQITGPDEYTTYILDDNGDVMIIPKL